MFKCMEIWRFRSLSFIISRRNRYHWFKLEIAPLFVRSLFIWWAIFFRLLSLWKIQSYKNEPIWQITMEKPTQSLQKIFRGTNIKHCNSYWLLLLLLSSFSWVIKSQGRHCLPDHWCLYIQKPSVYVWTKRIKLKYHNC